MNNDSGLIRGTGFDLDCARSVTGNLVGFDQCPRHGFRDGASTMVSREINEAVTRRIRMFLLGHGRIHGFDTVRSAKGIPAIPTRLHDLVVHVDKVRIGKRFSPSVRCCERQPPTKSAGQYSPAIRSPRATHRARRKLEVNFEPRPEHRCIPDARVGARMNDVLIIRLHGEPWG